MTAIFLSLCILEAQGDATFWKITLFFLSFSIPTPNVTMKCVYRPSTHLQTLLSSSVPRHSTLSSDFQQTAGLHCFASIHLTNRPVKNYHVLQWKCAWSYQLPMFPANLRFQRQSCLPVPPPHVTYYLPATVWQASKFIAVFGFRWLHISQTGRRMQSLHQASAHSHLSTFWAHSSTLEQDRATVCLKTCPQFKRHALYSTSKRIQATLITCLWIFFQLPAPSPLQRSKFTYKLCATIYFQQCLLVSRSLRRSASGHNFWEEVRENRLRLESAIPEVLRNIALHDWLYDGATKCQPLYLVTSWEDLRCLRPCWKLTLCELTCCLSVICIRRG